MTEPTASSITPSESPPDVRVSRMDDSPKGRILRAAAHLFATRGYGRATVRELAAAVGIQSGSLFHHFKDKEAILEAVMMEVIELNTERMIAARDAAETPLEELRALVRCELASMHGDTSTAMSLLVLGWGHLGEEAQGRILKLRDRYEQMFLDAAEGAADELIGLDAFFVRRFLYGVHVGTRTWYDPQGPVDLEGLTDRIMMLFVKRPELPCPS